MNVIGQTATAAKFILLALALAVAPAMAHNGRNQPAAGASATASATATIIDTLGAATPATTFSVFGTGGQSISPTQFAGPEFTLTEPTRIAEIGGFVNNCGGFLNGEAQCPSPPPFVVQIRAAKDGVPDSSSIIASFVLSDDRDVFRFSYESVHPNLLLGPGIYYALFATPSVDAAGSLIGQASSPFQYLSPSTKLGFLDVTTGHAQTGVVPAGVRILGAPDSVFDVCLRNDGNGNLLQWNSTTGQYKFTRCSDGFMLSGVGVAALTNNMRTLMDSKPDRRVSAGFNTGQLTGSATIYFTAAPGLWQIFRINSTNPAAVCVCRE